MSKTYIRNQTFLAEDLGDGVLLLNTEDNQVIELNRTGAQLWRRLQEPATRIELIGELKSLYPEEAAIKLEADADDFLLRATVCKTIQEIEG